MAKGSLERIHSMDSLRGLASVQVLFHHCLCMSALFYSAIYSEPQFIQNVGIGITTFSPIHMAWAGHEAVIFFFVMSGFVLSIPYYKGKASNYISFLIKRIFRIYLPYLIALVLGIGLNYVYVSHSRITALSEWFNGFYSHPVSLGEGMQLAFAMKGIFHNVVTSLWSLPVEIKISLLFPFVAQFLNRLNAVGCFLLLAANLLLYHGGKRLGLQDKWDDFSLFYYFSFFIMGAILSKYYDKVITIFKSMHGIKLGAVLLVIIFFYTYKWNVAHLNGSMGHAAAKFPVDYAVAIAALLLLSIASNNHIAAFLNRPYLIELGKISFSLYLIHPLVLGIIGFNWGGVLPVFVTISLSALLAIVLSIPFHYYIEAPLQKLGRNIGARFEKNKTIKS